MWVRDAAYIGLALLRLGHPEVVGAYIPSIFAPQEPDGRVPPIQGSDVPWNADEWDAQGETIFLATMYYRYTGEIDALRSWYPALRAAATFLVELRASQEGSDEPTRGLLPPSKSAEDLGPADQHYYWDNFWAVIGLEEAAFAAQELGKTEDATWMEGEADALRQAILDSVEAVMGSQAAYVPGAVEEVESSAMARGTVPALWPVRVLSPQNPLLARSFDEYHRRWIAPDAGGFRHRQAQFWPYGGLELAHGFLRLGQKDVLHEILGWTLGHQTLPGTSAWAEQVDPETGGFSGGDMPHAWAAASYATLVREMVVSENKGALELFTGVPDSWLEAGETISLKKAPTHFGVLDLHVESTVQQGDSGWDGLLTLTVSGATPPEGFRWQLSRQADVVDGPTGVAVDGDWLTIPSGGGRVQLTFSLDA
jgi:GH15 family glucan-1,4-alpha-glucosidase